jgi:uridine phosphorylase
MPARLRPTAPLAADAILVGDPGRALMLAQALLEQPKMSNHARGLWGYSGRTAAGEELTIQATGMGGPSAAVVLADLAELGVRRAIRVGTCAALAKLEPGALLLVEAAHAPTGCVAQPDEELTAALARALPVAAGGGVLSLDHLPRPEDPLPSTPAEGVDMQTAALFAAARSRQVRLAAILMVAQRISGEPLPDERLEAEAKRAGMAAATVLSG